MGIVGGLFDLANSIDKVIGYDTAEKIGTNESLDVNEYYRPFKTKGNKASIESGGDAGTALFGDDLRVFGLPFKYTEIADPKNRVFNASFGSDGTCIAFIQFGVANINRALYGKMNVDTLGKENNYLTTGMTESVSAAISSMYLNGDISGIRDAKLISFSDAMDEFLKYANASLSQVAAELELPTSAVDDIESALGLAEGGVLAFWTQNTSGLNEEVSNDYTTPDIVETMNANAIKRRENWQLYHAMGDVNVNGTSTAAIQNFATGVAEDFSLNIANKDGFFGTVASIFMNANKGSMGYYAKIWADSKNNTSYTLSFKFRSPYGNKYDIFRNVLLPFLLLHTGALPKQDGHFSYKEPFLCQVDFPGWFHINCGVISNLSWTKGGDNQLWSVDGLPLEMTVTMTIEDLYPIQLATKDISLLHYNTGLLSFLNAMAGSSFFDIDAVNLLMNYNKSNTKYLKDVAEYTATHTASPRGIFRNFTQNAFKNYIEEARNFS